MHIALITRIFRNGADRAYAPSQMRAMIIASLVVASCLGACGGRRIVPLLSSAGIPLTRTPSGAIPLEVVTRSTSVRDPLPVSGSGVVYGDFEAALGHAVSSAAVPWADANKGPRPGGWQLFVEVITAEAEHDGSRLVVTIAVRATLQTRVGGAHLAQTETACRDGGLVEADKGAPVLYGCMTRIGRDLTSWLPTADPGVGRKSGNAPPRTSDVPIGGAVGASGSHADTDGDGDSDTPGESD